MNISLKFGGQDYQIDTEQALDISIPVQFEGPRVQAFGAKPARAHPYLAGETALQVSQGAGCNCTVFEFSAHLHGTHTECLGHISPEQHNWQELLDVPPFQLAQIVTIEPKPFTESEESYGPIHSPKDFVLTRKALSEAWQSQPQPQAMIVRTLPNGSEKRSRDYGESMPAYFSHEAVEWIGQAGIEALLVDLPSIDRLEDQGQLRNHHIFWNYPAEKNSKKSITEFIYVPNSVPDGFYVLSLNLANIVSDATPSRPTLYPIL